ncbi:MULTISPECIES: sigma-70 family RNA polymerase sigma factor [unclassified Cytobacillus]|uniref:sigma-70 family RNA polymerase sigma factor n=1 Tax=unclassified Cytobacillus TaxID=2675268 RepID=UPI00203C8B77|nr:sigma-70 family RNA polymerase sigma factor [Cytobacillus sp. AMY 15.2]MCM3091836.1 sigma-70 family RNA polymerase sigma factor [Cytobacillus sp. AMY 15.2]
MESFEQVAVQFEPMIHQIIRSLNIYQNQEDYFQIGLIRLWEAWKLFDPSRGNFLTFAYSIVKQGLIDELRKTWMQKNSAVTLSEEFWSSVESVYTFQPLEKEKLLSYCSSLTQNQTIWVLSTFLLDLSTKEIAAQQGVTVSAVKAWKKGALIKLRTTIPQN